MGKKKENGNKETATNRTDNSGNIEKGTITEKNKLIIKPSKIVMVISICFVFLLLLLILIIPKNKNNNNSNNIDSERMNYTKNDISDYSLKFKCSLLNDKDEAVAIDKYTGEGTHLLEVNSYGLGDNILCNFETSNDYKRLFKEMTFVLTENYIKLEKAYSNDGNININTSYGNNNSTFVTISSKNNITNLNDIKFKFYVNGIPNQNEKYNIKLFSVRINTSSTTYDYLKQLTLEFDHYSNRVIRDNGKLIFQTATSDGAYKTTSEYTCKTSDDECIINNEPQTFSYQNSGEKDIVLIQDEENSNWINVFFDTNHGIIATYGGNPRWLYPKNDKNIGKYIYILDKKNVNYGIVDKKGKIVHDFNLSRDCLANLDGELCLEYSIEDNLFVDIKNDKYGIVKIDSNDIIIDYKYDNIKLLNNKYFKAKENGKWYLYSFANKDKLSGEEGYDNLFVVNDNILVVENDKYLYITDYYGKKLTEERIKDLSDQYNEYVCCGNNPGIKVDVKGNIVTITTYNKNNWEDYKSYEYNIEKSTLIEK